MGDGIKVWNKSIMAISWRGTFTRLVEPIRVSQLAVATWTQKDHSQETDGHYKWTSSLTPHLLKAICQFLLQLWIRYFPAWINEPENPFPTSTSAKQKPVHCSAMIAREIDDENADMDYHAVPPPEYQAGGDSKRENLCQQFSERVTWTKPGASSSGQLEAAGASSSGRLVATEDPSSEKKVHLHPNDDGRNTSGSSGILHTISSWRSTNFTIKYWTVHVQELVNIPPIFKISRSTLRFGANLQATAYELHLGLQRITKTSKDLIQSVQRQVKTLIDRKDAHNQQILNQNWSGWKFTCQILFCVLESRIQIHPIIGQQNGSPRSAIHLAPTYSCFDHSNQEAFSRKPERANFRIFGWENHFQISVQRHWMDNERQYRYLFAQL